MKSAPVDSLVAEFDRLRARCDELERRLARVESDAASARGADEAPPPRSRANEGEVHEEPFGPAVKRTSSSSHKNAVNKALSMLGLVPDAQDEEKQAQATQSHRHALGKALSMLGIAPQDEQPAGQRKAATQGHQQALAALAAMDGPGGKAAAAAGEETSAPPAAGTPGEAPAPASGEAEGERETVELADNLPAAAPRWESKNDPARREPQSVDLAAAVDVPLEETRAALDHGAVLLNAAVLLVAGGAALRAAGLVSLPGDAGGTAWAETGTGLAAVAFGALSLAWRRASIHVRALTGGLGVLLLHALSLLVMRAQPTLGPVAHVATFSLTAAVGARLVLATRHPLAIFVGLVVALALPPWLAPALALPYALAVNVAVGGCALRMGRLQPTVLAVACTILLLAGTPAHLAAPWAAAHVAVFLGTALAAPFLRHRASRTAPVLALSAFALAGWTAHALYDGPGLVKAAGLFVPATAAVLVAGRLHRREDLLRGALKAGAVVLAVAALPLGFVGQTLAAVTLFVAALFGVFAITLYDAYLRAAGALLLVIGLSIVLGTGAHALLWLGAAAVAALLYAVRVKGPNPVAVPVLLGGLAHTSLIAAVAHALPPAYAPWVLAALSLAFAAAHRVRNMPVLQAGAVLGAGAASAWALVGTPPAAVTLAVTGAALLPHFVLADPRRSPRAAGLFLLLAEVTLLSALLLSASPPVGVLVALPALALLALPPWGALAPTLRAHARFLALVLVARCLLPDLLAYDAPRPWLNLRAAAMLGAIGAALSVVRCSRAGRVAAATLATLAAIVLAATESGGLPYGLTAVLPAAALCGLLWQRETPGPDDGQPAEEQETAPAPESTP